MRNDVVNCPSDRAEKIVFRDLVHACGGVEPAARFSKKSVACISNYQGLNTDSFVPSNVITKLEEACGKPIMTAHLAACAGMRLVPLDPVTAPANWIAAMAGEAKASSALIAALAEALGDDHVSRAEAEHIARIARAQIAALNEVLRMSEAVAAEPGLRVVDSAVRGDAA